jgi:hypothetical protein
MRGQLWSPRLGLARADALRRARRMTHESFAAHLGVGVRTVAYWRQRPDTIPQQQMQDILDSSLERASEEAKARFLQLVGEADHAPSNDVGPGQSSSPGGFAQTDAGPLVESGQTVAVLDDLIGADMADHPLARTHRVARRGDRHRVLRRGQITVDPVATSPAGNRFAGRRRRALGHGVVPPCLARYCRICFRL